MRHRYIITVLIESLDVVIGSQRVNISVRLAVVLILNVGRPALARLHRQVATVDGELALHGVHAVVRVGGIVRNQNVVVHAHVVLRGVGADVGDGAQVGGVDQSLHCTRKRRVVITIGLAGIVDCDRHRLADNTQRAHNVCALRVEGFMSHRPGERVVHGRFGNIRDGSACGRGDCHHVASAERCGIGAAGSFRGVEGRITEVHHILVVCMGTSVVSPGFLQRFHIQRRSIAGNGQCALRFANRVVVRVSARFQGVAECVGTAAHLGLRSCELVGGAVSADPARFRHQPVGVLARHVCVRDG